MAAADSVSRLDDARRGDSFLFSGRFPVEVVLISLFCSMGGGAGIASEKAGAAVLLMVEEGRRYTIRI